MGAYILRRLLLIIPTLVGIMAINFAVIQFAPGGPVERIIAQVTGTDVSATERISGGGDFAEPGQDHLHQVAMISPRAIVVHRGWIRTSSRSWRSSSALTSRRWSASARC